MASYSNTNKAPTLDKRAKGFAVKLTRQQLLTVRMLYPWLKEQGLTNEQTDAAIETFPAFTPTDRSHCIDVANHKATKQIYTHLYGYKTFRVRAEHLAGVSLLLQLTATFVPGVHILRHRAAALNEISPLDQLADSTR